MADLEQVIIIGSGPAGYTAALYTSRANLHPLVIEGFAWGGLLQQTTEVENYPGFPEGIMGPEMMVTRRDEFRASKIMLERARSADNIEFLTPYVVDEFLAGEGAALTHARLRHVDTGETREIEFDGAFIAIGHEPQSELFRDQIELDQGGYAI